MFFSGGPMFGWARPVPYNPNLMRDRRWGPIMTMAAGPATNIMLALALGLVLRVVLAAGVAPAVMVQILATVVYVNLILAVFNLIPIPPFDGRFLLGLFSPSALFRAEMAMARMGPMGFMIGIFVGLFVVFPVVQPLIGIFFRFITGVSAL
jgi:Zn-dependent protease